MLVATELSNITELFKNVIMKTVSDAENGFWLEFCC